MFPKSLKYFSTLHRQLPAKIEHVTSIPTIPSTSNDNPVISNAKIFDPDSWPLFSWNYPAENAECLEKDISKNEEENENEKENRNEVIEENRAEGHAPIKTALSALMQGLHQSSSKSTSFSDVDVTLFNFHSTKFAERLLNRNVSSVVMVENSHAFSKNAKRFATQYRNVDGYRADILSLMGVGRKKTAKFPKKLLFSGKVAEWEGNIRPLTLLKDEQDSKFEETTKLRKPHLVTVLPTPTAQKTIVESLMQHAMLHHSKSDEDTLFAYGEANLLTFLSSGVLAQYMCSSDPRLQFLSNQHRRHSYVFNKLFEMNLIHTRYSDDNMTKIPIGYTAKSFHPQLPSAKKISHEKKLNEINFINGMQYPVRISPRRSIQIGGKSLIWDREDCDLNTLEPSTILPFAYFMFVVGKQSNAKQAINVLRALWPETLMSVSDSEYSEKIGIMPDSELEMLFLEVRQELEASKAYDSFVHDMRIKRII